MNLKNHFVYLSLLFLCISGATIQAQSTFTKLYAPSQNTSLTSIVEAPSGGYMVVGSTDSFGVGISDHYLLRLHADGTRAWSKTWGWGDADRLEDVVPMGGGNWMAVGATENHTAGGSDVFLMAVDSLGDTLWTQVIGGPQTDAGVGIAQGADGNFGVLAVTYSFDLNQLARIYFLRVSPTGQILNTQVIKGTDHVVPSAIRATTDGGYIISGYTEFASFSQRDAFLVKTDSLGSVQWNKNYGFVSELFATTVAACANGDYLLAGHCKLAVSGPRHAFMIRTNAQGDTLWTRVLSAQNGYRIYAVRETASGDFWAFGSVYDNASSGSENDQMLIRTTATGMGAQGYKTFLPESEWAFQDGGMALSSDGGIVTLSSTESFDWPTEKALIQKMDSTGQSYCYDRPLTPTYVSPPLMVVTSPNFSYSSGGLLNTGLWLSTVPIDTGFGPCKSCPGPTADFTWQIMANTLYFTNTSQTRAMQAIYWNFGDGNTQAIDPAPWHRYEAADSYLVCMTVVDTCGTDSVCQWINAPCPPPVVEFEIDTIIGFQVSFRNTSVRNFATDLQMHWDYGDGNVLNTLLVNNNYHVHRYDLPGTYVVCLTGTDSCATVTYCDTLTVTCGPPQVDFSYSTNPLIREAKFFNHSVTIGNSTCLWDFGDGNTSTQCDSLQHVYGALGTYVVCLYLTDSCGTDTLCDTLSFGLAGRESAERALQIHLFPNPGQDHFAVNMEAESGVEPMEVAVLDVTGRRLWQTAWQGNQRLTVPTQSLADGLYFVRIRDKEGRTFVEKWVKRE